MQGTDDPGHAEDPDDSDLELIEPEDFLPRNPFPLDAQRMGIDRWSDDAGMIAIASSLDSRKLSAQDRRLGDAARRHVVAADAAVVRAQQLTLAPVRGG